MVNYKSRGESVNDYDFIYQTEHGGGLCVRLEKNDRDIWLPLSRIQYDEGKIYKRGSVITVTIPDWLAEKLDLA